MTVFSKSDLELFHAPHAAPIPAGSKAVSELGERLTSLARRVANRLAKGEGLFLFGHTAGRTAGHVPEPGFPEQAVELMAAAGRSRAGLADRSFLAIGISHSGIHTHIIVPPDSEDARRTGGALRESSVNLARHHGYFGLLRSYAGWDGLGIPEVVTTRSPAFWDTLGVRLTETEGSWLDLGLAWPTHEVNEISMEDLIRSLKRLLPLYRMATEDGFKPILR